MAYSLTKALADQSKKYMLDKQEKDMWERKYNTLSLKEQRMLDAMVSAKAGTDRIAYQRQILRKSPDMIKAELSDPDNIKYYHALLAADKERQKAIQKSNDAMVQAMAATVVIDAVGRNVKRAREN